MLEGKPLGNHALLSIECTFRKHLEVLCNDIHFIVLHASEYIVDGLKDRNLHMSNRMR